MKNVVVFTGAGISAESGLETFRGINGLWDAYNIEDVATPAGWKKDRSKVLDFYNFRRKQCLLANPNAAHHAIKDLEKNFNTCVITQNIDDLHERAGSSNIIHLHGEILKAQSSLNPKYVYEMNTDEIKLGDVCELGSQLRPHVVWFGEGVPNLDKAKETTSEADIFIIIGTSLQVYPAANLVSETKRKCEIYLIDPRANELSLGTHVNYFPDTATVALPRLVELLTK